MVSIIASKQFNISRLFAHIVYSIWAINRALSGTTTTPGWSGPGSNGREGVLHIPQISKAGASPSDCLISYPGHLLTKIRVDIFEERERKIEPYKLREG